MNKIAKSVIAVAVMIAVVGCADKKATPPAADAAPVVEPKPYVPPPTVTPVDQGNPPVMTDKPVKPAGAHTTGTKTHTGTASADAAVAGKVYVVKAGDSLSKIAAHVYGKSSKKHIDAIKKANGLKTDTIRIGQKLKIPAA